LSITLSVSELLFITYYYYKKISNELRSTLGIDLVHNKINELKEIYSLILNIDFKKTSQVRNLIDKSRGIIKQLNSFSDNKIELNLLKINKFNNYLINNLKYLETDIIDEKVIEEKINSKYKKQIEEFFKKMDKNSHQKFRKGLNIFKLLFSDLIIFGFIIFSSFYLINILNSYNLYLIAVYIYYITLFLSNIYG
jgi:hypothetical protein